MYLVYLDWLFYFASLLYLAHLAYLVSLAYLASLIYLVSLNLFDLFASCGLLGLCGFFAIFGHPAPGTQFLTDVWYIQASGSVQASFIKRTLLFSLQVPHRPTSWGVGGMA